MAEIQVKISLTKPELDDKIIKEFREIASGVLMNVERKFNFTYIRKYEQFDIDKPKDESIYEYLKEIHEVYRIIKKDGINIFIAGIEYYR